MCLAIPMQVEEPLGDTAWCTGREGRKRIDLALVGPQPAGTWLLTFLGAAREVITAEAAMNTDRALDALVAVLEGNQSGIDEAFADLIGRTPELPEHLRRGTGPSSGVPEPGPVPSAGKMGSDPFSAVPEKGSDPIFHNESQA